MQDDSTAKPGAGGPDETTDPDISLPAGRSDPPPRRSSAPPPPPPARSGPPPLPPKAPPPPAAPTASGPHGPPARYGRTIPPTQSGETASRPPPLPSAPRAPSAAPAARNVPSSGSGPRPATPSQPSPGAPPPPRSPSIPPRAGGGGSTDSGQRIAQLQVHLRTARGRIDELEGELARLRAKLEGADRRIDELEEHTRSEQDDSAPGLAKRVVRTEERLDRFRADNARLEEDLTEERRKGDAREREIARLRSRMGDLETLLDDMQRCEVERQRRLAALEQTVADRPTTPSLPTVAAREAEAEDTRHDVQGPGEDDLRKIKGIGPATARKLREAGVRSWAQMAAWSEADVADVATRIGVKPARVAAWADRARALGDR